MAATADMDSNVQDFEFAFNSSNFSDRVLVIEIIDGPEEQTGGEGDGGSESTGRQRKRRREETNTMLQLEGDVELETYPTGVTLSCEQSGTKDDNKIKQVNQECEPVAAIEGPLSGDCPSPGSNSSRRIREKSLHVNSAILAAKSPFFFKLFSNGMSESNQHHVILRIDASEEVALMELLSFMYSGKLTNTSHPHVLDVLMAADKYEVPSCVRHCSQFLRSLPMCKESALLYLELPASVSLATEVQSLTDAARSFLVDSFKDLTKHQEGLMELPLVVIEAILASDDLQVDSEDAVYDFVVKWAHQHYPNTEERKIVLGSCLVPLIRFPFMTCRKLKKVLADDDMDKDIASKVVFEALFLKADAPHRRGMFASICTPNQMFVERAYKHIPVKVVEFELPQQHCVVYFDLKREECKNLFPSGKIYSQTFYLGGHGFCLSARCNVEHQSLSNCFGLFLGINEDCKLCVTVDYDFSARTASSGDFFSKCRGNFTFTAGKEVGFRNLFNISWTSFVADDCPYFSGDVLHLRALLTIKQQQQNQQQLQQQNLQLQQQQALQQQQFVLLQRHQQQIQRHQQQVQRHQQQVQLLRQQQEQLLRQQQEHLLRQQQEQQLRRQQLQQQWQLLLN